MNPMDPPDPLAARDVAHRAHVERLLLVCADTLDACGRLLAGGPGKDPEAYHHSLGLVARQLESAVAAEGLEAFGAVGERAAPATHEVVEACPAPPGAMDDEVLEVVRRGYRYRGNVLRAARVVVASTGGAEEGQRIDQDGPRTGEGTTHG